VKPLVGSSIGLLGLEMGTQREAEWELISFISVFIATASTASINGEIRLWIASSICPCGSKISISTVDLWTGDTAFMTP
jgi:hypothetical protein